MLNELLQNPLRVSHDSTQVRATAKPKVHRVRSFIRCRSLMCFTAGDQTKKVYYSTHSMIISTSQVSDQLHFSLSKNNKEQHAHLSALRHPRDPPWLATGTSSALVCNKKNLFIEIQLVILYCTNMVEKEERRPAVCGLGFIPSTVVAGDSLELQGIPKCVLSLHSHCLAIHVNFNNNPTSEVLLCRL